jgi:hypothetical protein
MYNSHASEIMTFALPSSMRTTFVNTSGFSPCTQIVSKIETYQPGRQLTIAHPREKISNKGLDFSNGNAVCCYKWLPMVVDVTKISVTCTQYVTSYLIHIPPLQQPQKEHSEFS